MNKLPSKTTVERLRQQYPAGTRVELVRMSDDFSKLKPGDRGTVMFCDDAGTLHTNWDCGSTLGIVYGEDYAVKVKGVTTMTEKIREQIMQIRDSGACNMVHAAQVQRLAFEQNFHELVIFISEHQDLYIRFILFGDAG